MESGRSNDNWKDSQQAAIQETGLAPSDDHEPAILTTLNQGNWTAIMRGKNNTAGVEPDRSLPHPIM
jgi:hypothetical protein